jgi:hypothetical protein
VRGFEVDINLPLLTEAPIIGGVYPETVTLLLLYSDAYGYETNFVICVVLKATST